MTAKRSFKTVAQSTIEFTFAVVGIMFLIYGMVMVFRWAGMDLANRRFMQENSIQNLDSSGDPASELNSASDYFQPISAVYRGGITGNTGQ
jgi:hypothetical protein